MAYPFLIGIGSPYGDDQVGWKVIQLVRERGLPLQGQCCAVPATTLLPLLQQQDNVILIDAVVGNAPLGSVQHWVGIQAISSVQQAISSHGFDLATLLSLAQRLDMLPSQVQLYGIVIDPNTLPMIPDQALSPLIAAAAEQLVTRLQQ